ncbi:GGDEF domain-containing protein, partial [Hydrogenovibrio sp. SC-1]|uniref:EAL domain-containing protein n=1 Tax=Hydrogenovibrio sp. SC-1 TaxID=2065820 RepID=UPI000CADB41E
EALLRWNDPQNGLVYPESFLSLVEHDSSIMIDLGHWVLETALSQLETWLLAGLDISLSINVSSHELQHENFVEVLQKLLTKHHHIKPNLIEIEILETLAFENFELTSDILNQCSSMGISIAIDDFGTGYASLNYLKKLPKNTLKIDKSFVIDLLTSSQNMSIVEASIGLANAFNSHVVAEGVESEKIGEVLLQLGCEIAQGYAISEAMPAQEVEDWIQSWKGFSSWEKVKPLNPQNRAILHTEVEHKNWINAIEAFIQNRTSELPNLNSSQCYLGNWLINESSKAQREHPEFNELKEIHDELHHYAEKLLRSNKKDKQAGVDKIVRLHKKILVKLNAIMEG